MAEVFYPFFAWVDGVLPKTFYFDLLMSSTTTYTTTHVRHQVEQGIPISDHARDELTTLSLEVHCSDTPTKDLNRYGGVATPVVLQPRTYTPDLLSAGLVSTIRNAISSVATPPVSVSPLYFPLAFSAEERVVEILDRIRTNGLLVDVYLPGGVVRSNMVVTKFVPKRDSSSGGGVDISIEMQEQRVVTVRTVPAPTIPRAKPKAPKGPAPLVSVPDNGPQQSIFSRILGR